MADAKMKPSEGRPNSVAGWSMTARPVGFDIIIRSTFEAFSPPLVRHDYVLEVAVISGPLVEISVAPRGFEGADPRRNDPHHDREVTGSRFTIGDLHVDLGGTTGGDDVLTKVDGADIFFFGPASRTTRRGWSGSGGTGRIGLSGCGRRRTGRAGLRGSIGGPRDTGHKLPGNVDTPIDEIIRIDDRHGCRCQIDPMGSDRIAARAFVHGFHRDASALIIDLNALSAAPRVNVIVPQGRVGRVRTTRITIARAKKDRAAIGVVIGTAAADQLGMKRILGQRQI